MSAPETRERELAPLRKIRDNYEKIVIALECGIPQTQDGIKIIRATDFLLEDIIPASINICQNNRCSRAYTFNTWQQILTFTSISNV